MTQAVLHSLKSEGYQNWTWNSMILAKKSSFSVIFGTLPFRGCGGQPLALVWDIRVKSQMPTTTEHAFKERSTTFLVLLPLRTISNRTFQCKTPCIMSKEDAQDYEFPSSFWRIKDTINCFWYLLTFNSWNDLYFKDQNLKFGNGKWQ